MTISYNNNIPAANNNPSSDQPLMQQNTNAVDTILQTDHVSFNTAGGGRHNQVTFNSNNPPGSPVSPPVLFTNNQDGAGNALPGSVSELFFYSGDAASSQNQFVSQANGSVIVMGGIIIKWGTANLPGTGFNQPVTFPVAFPNNCFSVVAIANAASNTVTVASCTSLATNGFTAIKTSSGTAIDINYIAIGN